MLKYVRAILNLCMKCWSRLQQATSLWMGPCGDKPRPASPNHHSTSALFWDIMQHTVAIPCQHFGKTYWPHFQRSRNPQGRKEDKWS